MIAGGISIYGTGKLILLYGKENEFCYAQAILNYKKDIEELKGKNELIFELDGAPAHTCKSNNVLLNKCFGENWIQNPPNSPKLPRFSISNKNFMGNIKRKNKKKIT